MRSSSFVIIAAILVSFIIIMFYIIALIIINEFDHTNTVDVNHIVLGSNRDVNYMTHKYPVLRAIQTLLQGCIFLRACRVD